MNSTQTCLFGYELVPMITTVSLINPMSRFLVLQAWPLWEKVQLE